MPNPTPPSPARPGNPRSRWHRNALRWRPNARRRTQLYIAAALSLLLLTALLRLWQLPQNILWYDEATAANHARQPLPELLHQTRHNNTSPILNPLILHAAQKIASTPLTVRAPSAIISILTIAAILILLPRARIPRPIALLTALLAILSVPAIQQSQEAREYTLDAFIATLMIIGLLHYLRRRQKTLLTLTLLIAPLTQYGLILLAPALICAAALHHPQPPRPPNANRIRHWLKTRQPLIPPTAAFLTGCAITYALTLRYQLDDRNRVIQYLQPGYYQGDWSAPTPIIQFAISRTRQFLQYHLPQDTETLALAALTLALTAALIQRKPNPILTLLLLALTTAIAAALLKIYPLGDFKQTLYLAPALYLAAATALHTLINLTPALYLTIAAARRALINRPPARRAPPLLAPAATLLLLTITAAAGIQTIQHNNPYRDLYQAQTVFAALKHQPQAHEIIYASAQLTPTIKFYQRQLPPADYHYCHHHQNFGACQPDILKQTNFSPTGQTWLLGRPQELQTLKPFDRRFRTLSAQSQDIVLLQIQGRAIPQQHWQTKISAAGPPIIQSTFNIHLTGSRLLYIKNPCHPADTIPRFALHLYPADPADLPPDRQPHGFDNQDFTFRNETAAIINQQCLAEITLPPYPITAIRTGQFTRQPPGNHQTLWSAHHPLPP